MYGTEQSKNYYFGNYLLLNLVKVCFLTIQMVLNGIGKLKGIYVRCCTKQELWLLPAYHQILLDIKIYQSINLLLIFNHLSQVQLCLDYNIEKSGFNAVSIYLLLKNAIILVFEKSPTC